jgi:hypothetical protein
MLPHIITSQIDEAEATAAVLSDRAGACKPEQEPLRVTLLSGSQAIKDMCKLARELGLAAVLNRDTIINRRAS